MAGTARLNVGNIVMKRVILQDRVNIMGGLCRNNILPPSHKKVSCLFAKNTFPECLSVIFL